MREKRAILTVGTISLFVLNFMAAFLVPVAWGSEVFSDDFETGDMSLWTNHSGAGYVDVTSSLKHHGAYSANFSVVTPSAAMYYWKDLGSEGYADLFFRCCINFLALPTSGYTTQLLALYGTSADQEVTAALSYYDGVSYYWRLQAPGYDVGSLSPVESNTWYCLEIQRAQGVGTGVAKLWVDGTLLQETSNLTIYRNSRYPNVGITFTNFTNAVVYDCCEVATAYIGEDRILFSDGFESGDDSAWTSSSGAHSVNTTVAHSGTYSFRFGHTPGFVEKNITSSTTIYYRWYAYIQNLSLVDGEYVMLSRVRGSDGTPVTGIYIDYSVDHYRLELQWAHPSLGIVHHDYPFVSDAWYCFEEKAVIGTSGEFRVWVNGVEEITRTGLDTSAANDCQHIELGFTGWNWLGWRGYIFLDDTVISTSYVQAIISVTNPHIVNMLSDVSESEIYASVYHLQNFTTRKYGTAGNLNAGTYLYNRLSAIQCLDVEFQSSHRNIIATLNGTDPTSNATYIIGAHYDSTSNDPNNAPGATDNGGGVAIVLELARIMIRYRYRYTLKFAFWNCEEEALNGSTDYAQYAKANGLNVSLYFNYDSSCYDPNNRMVLDIMYNSKSVLVKNLMTQHNALYGVGFMLTYNAWHCSSDHTPFWGRGYTAAMTHAETHGTQYHASNDTVDKISLLYAKKNGQLGMSVVAELAEVESLIGDINADYVVNAQDLLLYNEAYGAMPSDTNWNMVADLNNDGLINVEDLRMLARNYG